MWPSNIWFWVKEAISPILRSQTQHLVRPLVTAISWLVIEYLSDCLWEDSAVFIWHHYQEKWETLFHRSSGVLLCCWASNVWILVSSYRIQTCFYKKRKTIEEVLCTLILHLNFNLIWLITDFFCVAEKQPGFLRGYHNHNTSLYNISIYCILEH